MQQQVGSFPRQPPAPWQLQFGAPLPRDARKTRWAPKGITPGQRSLQLRAGPSCGAAFTLLAAQIRFYFLIQKSPLNMRKGTGTSKRQLFKRAPEVLEEGVASLVQPTADSRNR